MEFLASNRIPAIFENREWVEAGGLISYGPNYSDVFRRAAIHMDKILKGTKPADIPVEQPTKFEMVINLKTAQQIGVTIPPNVLARADRGDQIIQFWILDCRFSIGVENTWMKRLHSEFGILGPAIPNRKSKI